MNTNRIIIFDGNCNLCNHSMNYILKKDINKIFFYLSNESDEAKKILETFKIHESSKSSIVFIENYKVYLKSTAVLKIAKHLSGAIKLTYLLIIIPQILRDPIYDWVSKHRHHLFKKPSDCVINTKNINKI